jgi:hypothetical protein
VLGYSPLHAALFMLPSSAMAFVGGPLAGWLIPRHGADRVVTTALLVGGCGLAGLFLSAHAGAAPQLLSLAAFGLGHASADRAGMAASIEEVSIELGGAIGLTVLGSVLAGVYAMALVLPGKADFPPAVRSGIDEALVVAQPCRPTSRARSSCRCSRRSTVRILQHSPSRPPSCSCWPSWDGERVRPDGRLSAAVRIISQGWARRSALRRDVSSSVKAAGSSAGAFP